MRTIVLGKSELSIKVLLGDRGREEGTYFHELDLVDVGNKICPISCSEYGQSPVTTNVARP